MHSPNETCISALHTIGTQMVAFMTTDTRLAESIKRLRRSMAESESSPVPCSTLRRIGLVLVLLFVSSIVSNLALLRMFVTYKHLKTSMSTFVVSLTIINLVASLTELPVSITSHMMCKYKSIYYIDIT